MGSVSEYNIKNIVLCSQSIGYLLKPVKAVTYNITVKEKPKKKGDERRKRNWFFY